MAGVKKLSPRGGSHPVAVCMPDAAHETLNWSCLRSCGLLQGKLKDCLQLFPEGWPSLTPGVPFGVWHQRLGDRLEVIPSSLGRPRMFLKKVLLGFGEPVCPCLRGSIGWVAVAQPRVPASGRLSRVENRCLAPWAVGDSTAFACRAWWLLQCQTEA